MNTLLARLLVTLSVLFALPFLASAATTTKSKTTNVSIPDNGGWVYSLISISDAPAGAVVSSVQVYFACVHPYSGDMEVDLEVGTYSNSKRLWDNEGAGADNPSRTTTTSSFNGLPVNNGWYLYARDTATGDGGYIDEWTITITYTVPNPQSDIVVQGSPSISPSPVVAGNAITVSYTIKNQGAGNAGGSETKIQVKNSSGTQITAPTFSEGSLSAGASASRSRSVTIPSGSAAGTYTAYVILDNQDDLDQSNRDNDLTPGVNFAVTAPVQQCDIVVQGTPTTAPDPVVAGNAITVSYTLRNQGAGNAGTSETKIQVKNSSGTQITAPTFSEGSLSAGASASRSRSVTIPSGSAAGTYTAYVILDNQDDLDQSNRDNDLTPGVNFAVTAPVQQCDIVVQGTPTTAPDPVVAGNAITVSYTLRNQGAGNAGTSETKIQVKNSSGTQITAPTFSEASLSAGASASRSRNVTIPSGSASGTYRVYVILDNDSDLDQISDANDYASPATFVVRQSVTPPTLPNLRFAGSLSAAVSQGSGNTPSRLSVSALANNNGQSSSGAWRARLRLTTLGGESLHNTSTEYGALNSGQSHNVVFADVPLSGALASGTFRAEVTLDSDNSVSELNESDNATTSQFTVAPTPTSSAGEPSWTRWVPALYYTPSRTETIDSVVIHTTGGGTYQGNVNYFSTPSPELAQRMVSAHYVVGPLGDVTQMVRLSDTAHHATYYNSRSIGIEVVGLPNDPNTWTPEVYNSLKKLVEYFASRFSIPLSHPSGDATTYPKLRFDEVGIVGHQQIQPIETPDYSAKQDPGPHFDWTGFMGTVGATYQQASLQLRFGSQAPPATLPTEDGPQFGPLDAPESTEPALMISLPAERVVVIESSDDLVTWNVDATLTAGEGTTEYPVNITTHKHRFFRLRWGIRE